MWLKDARDLKTKAQVSNRMRHFLELDPDFTTLYFKAHQNSIKDGSTMKNALGYKFEKKKKEDESPANSKSKFGNDNFANHAGRRPQGQRDYQGDKKSYNKF